MTEDYNLELQYRKSFLEIWEEEKDDRELGPLSERMGVRNRATGELNMTEEEKDAASKYCFTLYTFLLLTFIQASTMPFVSTRSKSGSTYLTPYFVHYVHSVYSLCNSIHFLLSRRI